MDSNPRSPGRDRNGQRMPSFRFAADSSLEGDGFEPSVPVAREPVYIAEGELRGDRRAAKKIWWGTDGSNPSPSSGESTANLASAPRAPGAAPAGNMFFKRLGGEMAVRPEG